MESSFRLVCLGQSVKKFFNMAFIFGSMQLVKNRDLTSPDVIFKLQVTYAHNLSDVAQHYNKCALSTLKAFFNNNITKKNNKNLKKNVSDSLAYWLWIQLSGRGCLTR